MLSTLMVSVAPGGVVNAPLRRAAKGVGHSGDGVPSCSQSIRLGNSRASGPQRRGLQGGGAVTRYTSPPPPPAAGSRGSRSGLRRPTRTTLDKLFVPPFLKSALFSPTPSPYFPPISLGLADSPKVSNSRSRRGCRRRGKLANSNKFLTRDFAMRLAAAVEPAADSVVARSCG